MVQSRKVIFTYIIHRCLATSSINNNMNHRSMARQGKFIRKIMGNDAPKSKWYAGTGPKPQPTLQTGATKTVSHHVKRRLDVLNKLFMLHISDLMATEEVSSELLNRGVEISQVNLTNDFKVARVYWYTSETDVNRLDETTKILTNIGFKLRHELSQLRVIGVVPPIIFVQDKSVAVSLELERRLAEADYGEDFVPTIKMPSKKPELVLFTKLSEDVKEKMVTLQDEKEEKVDVEELDVESYAINLPPMTHNVLGINHVLIMSKIINSLSKARAVKVPSEYSPSLDIQQKFNPEALKMFERNQDMKAFDDFLVKRQIEEKRRNRLNFEDFNDITDDDDECDDSNEIYDRSDDYENCDAFDDIDSEEIYR